MSDLAGVFRAVVTDNNDPDGLGQVRVKIPSLGVDATNWAPVVTAMTGDQLGAEFLPAVDDEVLVAFEAGNIDYPCVIGALRTAAKKPPLISSDAKNQGILKSRSGLTILLDDTKGGEKIVIGDGAAENQIVIDVNGKTLTIKTKQGVKVDTQGAFSIQCQSFSLKADDKVEIQGSKLTVNNGGLEVQ